MEGIGVLVLIWSALSGDLGGTEVALGLIAIFGVGQGLAKILKKRWAPTQIIPESEDLG